MKKLFLISAMLVFSIICIAQKGKWKKAQEVNTIASYQAFMDRYPDSEYFSKAKKKFVELEFERVKNENTLDAYEYFLNTYKDNPHVEDAKSRMVRIEFYEAKDVETIEAYNKFLNKYPDSEYSLQARRAIYGKEYSSVNRRDPEELRAFINKYPKSYQAKLANEILTEMGFSKATEINTREAYEQFIREFPGTESAKKAEKTIIILEKWKSVENNPTMNSYFSFQEEYPRSNMRLSDDQLMLIKTDAINNGQYEKGFEVPIIINTASGLSNGTIVPSSWIRSASYEVLDNQNILFKTTGPLSTIDNKISYIIHFYSENSFQLAFNWKKYSENNKVFYKFTYKYGKGFVIVRNGKDLKFFEIKN